MKCFNNLVRASFALLVLSLGYIENRARGSTLVDFGDLSLAPSSHWSGPDPGGTLQTGPFGDHERVGQFTSQGAGFVNRYSLDYGNWEGFAYSNILDKSTSGFSNQYAAYSATGGGVRGAGSNYAVAYEGSYQPTIVLPAPTTVLSADITNTTYAYLAMLDGSPYSKQFTGSDWLKLTVSALDASSQPTGTPVDLYLAQGTNFVIDWTNVDLTSLGDHVKSLQFHLSSTDNGAFGMNTPAYFAVGDLNVVPEPSSLALLGGGALSLWAAWRRRTRGIR
jgi:hypothetical protein